MCLFVELLLMYSVLLIYILESALLKIVLKFMHEVLILIKYAFLVVLCLLNVGIMCVIMKDFLGNIIVNVLFICILLIMIVNKYKSHPNFILLTLFSEKISAGSSSRIKMYKTGCLIFIGTKSIRY